MNCHRPRATCDEILETVGMAIYMGAGPSAMYASHAFGACAQFAAARADAA
jgi:alkylhydroperoxidase/carboxymuconolactone decarboxylase family protein YurZ